MDGAEATSKSLRPCVADVNGGADVNILSRAPYLDARGSYCLRKFAFRLMSTMHYRLYDGLRAYFGFFYRMFTVITQRTRLTNDKISTVFEEESLESLLFSFRQFLLPLEEAAIDLTGGGGDGGLNG